MKTYISLFIIMFLFSMSGCSSDEVTQLNKDYAAPDTEQEVNPLIDATTVRLGTYNFWGVPNRTGDYVWSKCHGILAQSFVDNDFDVVGFQECDETIENELPHYVKELSDDYAWWFDVNSNVGFAYKKDRFTISEEKKVFKLSDTPENLSSKCWDGYNRVGVYAEFRDVVNRREFAMIVTHGPLSKNPPATEIYHNKMAALLQERAELYNTRRLPVILVGDLNTDPQETAYDDLVSFWTDTYTAADSKYVYGPVGTFNSHNTAKPLDDELLRCDYVMVHDPEKEVKILSYRNDITTYLGLYPSDHCPVSAQMNISRKY